MRPRKTVTAALLSTLAFAATGCGISGHHSKCSGNRCTYAFNGSQTLRLDFLRKGSRLKLEDFGDDQIKVAASGRETTLPVGRRVSFAGYLLDLEKLEGDKGLLQYRGTCDGRTGRADRQRRQHRRRLVVLADHCQRYGVVVGQVGREV